MYRLYVRYKGLFALIEEFERVEEVQSKIDRYIESYEEVIVLNENMGYVMGKKKEEEKGKVLKKKK